MMNMLVGVLVEVIKTVSEIEREQTLGFLWIFGILLQLGPLGENHVIH